MLSVAQYNTTDFSVYNSISSKDVNGDALIGDFTSSSLGGDPFIASLCCNH